MWGKKINIYILTSDRGIDTIEGFQYCFNKYWNSSQQVTILGYRSPTFKLNDNFRFISLGEDRGANYIGGDLINFFKDVDETIDNLKLNQASNDEDITSEHEHEWHEKNIEDGWY